MTKASKTKKGLTEKRERITRSIAFEPDLHAWITYRAEQEKRSFNWIINDLVRKDDKTKG